MALGFFRRNQKIVILIMVLLMVAFLIPTGASTLMQKDPLKQKMADTKLGDLTLGEMRNAMVEVQVLGMLGLGNRNREMPWPTDLEFMYVQANGERDASLAYAMLLKEARTVKVAVTEADVDGFLAQLGWGKGQRYDQLVSMIRSGSQGWTESVLRSTVADWLRITKCRSDAEIGSPPSEAEIRLVYRDVFEQIAVRVAKVDANEFIKNVRDPNEDEMRRQFDLYCQQFAGMAPRVTDFGFGYHQPGKAGLRYLLVRGDVIQRVVEPKASDVYDFYNQNRASLTKEVPLPQPATKPGDANATTQPTEMKKVQLTFAEAKPQILERMRSDAARVKMDEVQSQVEAAVRRAVETAVPADQVYAKVRALMDMPAEPLLTKPLPAMKLANVTLEEAVRRLAEAAGIRAIAYPWGTHTNQTLLPTVKVSLEVGGETKTLADALRKITQDVKWPELVWRTAEGFPGVLFSVAQGGKGIDFFPVKAGEERALAHQQIAEHEVFGFAFASPSGPSPNGENAMANMVFTAERLSPNPKLTPLVKVGDLTNVAYVFGDRPGRLLFLLTAVYPSHVPTEMDAALRAEVARDWKLQKAYAEALQAAEKMQKAAGQIGLEAVAKAQKKDVQTTRLFARRRPDLNWSTVPELDMTAGTPQVTMALREYTLAKAFELTPKDVNNFTKEPAAFGVVSVPIKQHVLVLERTEYKPLLVKDYEEFGRPTVARMLGSRRYQIMTSWWFGINGIKQRLNFRQTDGRESDEGEQG
jgi:hypothetical protein